MYKRVKYYIFLKDVFFLTIGAFGGPQAHMALMLDTLVQKRKYLSEEDLIELNALCSILPGPTSTQTLTAIGFKIGGPNLAYLTLLVWIIPAVTIMTIAALTVNSLQARDITLDFTRFIQPMAVGFVGYAAYRISSRVVNTKTGIALMVAAGVITFFVRSPYMFPVILLISGVITSMKFKGLPIEEKGTFKIKWANFILWGGVFLLAAGLGGLTRELPIRLFENFYRNGSLIFGGGQVLVPMMYTEFVEFKEYLTSEEFLTGYAFVQSIPGPTFSFSAYIGTLSMREYGLGGQILGSFVASAGIFLPGTFLIFFVIRFWENLKRYRVVRASLEGINGASSGMVAAAAVLMFEPLDPNFINFGLTAATFILLMTRKVPAPFIIIIGLLAGIFIKI